MSSRRNIARLTVSARKPGIRWRDGGGRDNRHSHSLVCAALNSARQSGDFLLAAKIRLALEGWAIAIEEVDNAR